tara:strand:- start:55 stop:864 length:810 start_codon:yes stop_codon:yes gene_type:complete
MMKKILGIVILSLFFSVNVYAETQNYSNGDKYVGQTKLLSGKRHGQGTYYFADGRKYVGEWKKDLRHGQGSLTFPSGESYVGEWKDNLRNGKGTEIYKDGTKYVGEFKNNKRHGIGTGYNKDGSKIPGTSGIWENDNFVKAYTKPVKEKKKVKVATSSNSQTSNTSSNDKIAQSKQICKDLGFKVNTEKFADCALKMMSMQFEVSNKVASSAGTKQEIIVKHKNDYDIWDALLDTSALLSNNNTSNSSSSTGTNCKVYQREWGADMVCR